MNRGHTMFEAVRDNLSNLTNFSGRDSRSTFWFYILFLIIIQFAISIVLWIVAGGAMMASAFHSASHGADQAAMQQEVLMRMGGMMRASMWGSALLSLAMTVLIAASFTRRLHDSNKPGWIAAVTVIAQFALIGLTISNIDQVATFVTSLKPDDPATMQAAIHAQQGKFALQRALGWLPTLAVIVFGAWPSSDGDNRYGSEPDHL